MPLPSPEEIPSAFESIGKIVEFIHSFYEHPILSLCGIGLGIISIIFHNKRNRNNNEDRIKKKEDRKKESEYANTDEMPRYKPRDNGEQSSSSRTFPKSNTLPPNSSSNKLLSPPK